MTAQATKRMRVIATCQREQWGNAYNIAMGFPSLIQGPVVTDIDVNDPIGSIVDVRYARAVELIRRWLELGHHTRSSRVCNYVNGRDQDSRTVFHRPRTVDS